MTFSPDSLTEAAQQATPGPWRIGGNVITDEMDVVALKSPTAIHRRVARASFTSEDAALIAMLSPERVMLLAELWKAAEKAVILEYDPGRGPSENAEITRRAKQLRSVLARLAGHEEDQQ